MKKYRVRIKAEEFDCIIVMADDEEEAEFQAMKEYKKRLDEGFYGNFCPMVLTIENISDK